MKYMAVVVVALAVVGLAARWRQLLPWPDVVLLIPVAAAAYLLAMHVGAFRSLLAGDGDPVLTGRYMLPFIPVYGLTLALAVSWMPRRPALVAAGALLGGLCLLSIGALGFTYARYYA
jgi:hypothetical protein